jgi:WD40 repeat protein
MLVFKGHRKRVRCLAFAPDGTLLASAAGKGHAISLWDTRAGKRLRFLTWHQGVPTSLTFSPAGDLLASTDTWSQSQLWEMPSGEPRFRGVGGAGRASQIAFAPDGKTYLAVVWGGRGYEIRRCDPTIGAAIEIIRGPAHYTVSGIALGPGGQLAVGAGRSVDIWNLSAKKLRMSLSQTHPVRSVAYDPDGRTLAFAVRSRVTLWDTAAGQSHVILKGHEKVINSITFGPDSRTLVSGSNDGTVRVWDVASGRQVTAYDWQIGQVHAVAVAPDGMRAAAGGDGPIVVWDLDG